MPGGPSDKPRRITVFLSERTYEAIKRAAIEERDKRGSGQPSITQWAEAAIERALGKRKAA